ncbi:MAG: hypothetical protein A3I06_06270 [Candidatus Lindowbacteria bacterium RIFCSPLOWO2_02_FULL_62_12]|nr:MAG: hypothetical protein A3I06_06270 [Candidatus Lindowbacteria bacterium RIFCSPLOWO2_02_FULL_62_12]
MGALAAILLCFSLPAKAADLEVQAGEPAAVVWTVPANPVCGEPFGVKLEVRDRFGNVVTDMDRRSIEMDISVSGRGEIWPKSVLPRSFVRGVAELQMIYKVAERIELVARSTSGAVGRIEARSAPFVVAPGKLSEIRVTQPATARAGVPFRLTIMALDAFGNIIKEFNKQTEGVILSSDGFGRLTPTRVMPAQFGDGVADAAVTYTGTGEVEVRARDPKTGVVGKAPSKLSVASGAPHRFQITAPPAVPVDEPFDVAITALDEFGNVVMDYDAIGTVVYLSADGTASPSPSELPAKLFVKGVAFVRLTYPKTEQILLAASEPGTRRSGVSGTVDIQPGRPRRLELSAPGEADAGAPFAVKIRAVDSKGNPSKSPEGTILLTVQGTVRTTPIEIAPHSFVKAIIERKVSYNVAEDIRITAQDAGGLLRSEPIQVRVRPGMPADVEITTASVATAGSGIPVALTVIDAYRNPVAEFGQGSVLVQVDGPQAPAATEIPAASFAYGKSSATLPYYRTGTVRVIAELPSGRGKRALSGPIEVMPAALHHFDVTTPAAARAGAPYRIAVTARDAYGNTVTDYHRSGSGILIQSSGIGEVQPAQVAPAAFKDGVAQVELRSFVAERILLTASERFGTAAGQSGHLKVNAGPLSQFLVSVAPKVRAGEPFPVRIEAQDMYYNLIREFDEPGKILLASTGQNRISPDVIHAGNFSEGIAIVSVTLASSGKTEITASTEDRRGSGRSNTVEVLPGSAATFRVDVLDQVIAGEPVRVRVTALDAYGNPVEDARSIGQPVQIDIGGAGARPTALTPSSFTPQMFTRGVSEGYLVYPEAGRITIQVKGAPAPALREPPVSDWRPRAEGLFFKAAPDRTDVYVVASGPIDYRASQPTQFGSGLSALVISLPQTGLLRVYDYDALDLPGLRAAKLAGDGGEATRLVLKIDAAYAYSILSRANLLHITLRPGAGAPTPTLTQPTPVERQRPAAAAAPSMADVQALVDKGEYRAAKTAIEQFIAEHPGHPEATSLRARLEKVLRVLGE